MKPFVNLLQRLINRILRITSGFIDSYSLYLNLLPPYFRVKELTRYSSLGKAVRVKGRIRIPTPFHIEMGNNVSIRAMTVAPEKHVLIERDTVVNDLYCQEHSIVSNQKHYIGKEITGNLITISIDFEGGVALSHAEKGHWGYLKRFWDSREATMKLAALFKKYRIPVTWAACGHLFLKECTGEHGITEKDWFGEWFKYDPASNYLDDTSWYMPEEIKKLAGEPLFEIGYHSFGHYFYKKCSIETIVEDIHMAETIRKEWGLKLESFVFPYNQCDCFSLLVERGRFRNFRGNIGCKWPMYGVYDFKDFRFFNTTQIISPDTMEICTEQLNHLSSNRRVSNYFTHCYQWSEKDAWDELEAWLKELRFLRDSGKIGIKAMRDI